VRQRLPFLVGLGLGVALVGLGFANRLQAQAPSRSKSPHGPLDLDCAECHTPERWTPVLRTPIFRHESTGFLLQGSHSQVACGSCHRSLVFSGWRPASTATRTPTAVSWARSARTATPRAPGRTSARCSRCTTRRASRSLPSTPRWTARPATAASDPSSTPPPPPSAPAAMPAPSRPPPIPTTWPRASRAAARHRLTARLAGLRLQPRDLSCGARGRRARVPHRGVSRHRGVRGLPSSNYDRATNPTT
jgi:hypothetical protein